MEQRESVDWPTLPFEEWAPTHATLHLWMQLVGKIRLAQMPWINHSWHVALYVTARGLTTLAIPHGTRTFQLDFDFIEHRLSVHSSEGGRRSIALAPKPVAAFYRELMAALDELGLQVKIARNANELPQAIRLDEDEAHRAYDAHYARRFWQVLCHAHRVLTVFRARFRGKSSPVHFFWGNMDLALTRFSGRRAPEHPGGRPHLPDRVLRDAYSDECIEFGFWPGEDENPEPLFFCVAYPEPPGFRKAGVKPSAAHYHEALQEFVLPYEHVRQAQSPDAAVLDFFQTAYEAAAMLGRWDRKSLE